VSPLQRVALLVAELPREHAFHGVGVGFRAVGFFATVAETTTRGGPRESRSWLLGVATRPL
jgi:hypothetical protein